MTRVPSPGSKPVGTILYRMKLKVERWRGRKREEEKDREKDMERRRDRVKDVREGEIDIYGKGRERKGDRGRENKVIEGVR